MKYFLDTEFLEGTQNKNFLGFIYGKTKSTIDLISIGIVAEDGHEYYAISKDFNLKEAWNRFELVRDGFRDCGMTPHYKKVYWLRANVLKPIWLELRAKEVVEYNVAERRNVILDYPMYSFTYNSFKRLINKYGKTNKQIAEEIKEFVYKTSGINNPNTIGNWEEAKHLFPISFYAYYSDYDWVVFCWLFGKMIELPKGFPMYCIDLKQEKDRIIQFAYNRAKNDFERNLVLKMDEMKDYPKQTNEHNALADAKWNYKLYKFLNKL